MRTVLLGGLVAGLVGIGAGAGLASWSDLAAASTMSGPRLEVSSPAQSASGSMIDDALPTADYAAADLRPAFTPAFVRTPIETAGSAMEDETLHGDSFDDTFEDMTYGDPVIELALDVAPLNLEPEAFAPVLIYDR